jgi:dTDP-4-amino-4,6-dideoxygalactose transaminase
MEGSSLSEGTLPFALPDIGDDEIAAVTDALRSGWLSSGPRVKRFERSFAEVCGAGIEAIALNSATAGLHLALEGLGVGPGAEVLVPTWTFTATAEVILHLGADPVFVDSDPRTLNIDLEDAARKVSSRTRAILPVHFAGELVSYPKLAAFAHAHSLAVLEDAAHAFPASSHGVLVGAGQSVATVFSFYATKTITTGDGGMLVTRDPDLAHRVRTMRLHGIDRDAFDRYRSESPAWSYKIIAPGFKYNLTDPAAALGLVQLDRAEKMRHRREQIAERYLSEFTPLPLDLPSTTPFDNVHAWHLFVIRLRRDAPITRDEFIARMARLGVGCSVHFIPLHMHPFWRDRYELRNEEFPVATGEFHRVVSVPIFSGMREEQVDRVVKAVLEVLQ